MLAHDDATMKMTTFAEGNKRAITLSNDIADYRCRLRRAAHKLGQYRSGATSR